MQRKCNVREFYRTNIYCKGIKIFLHIKNFCPENLHQLNLDFDQLQILDEIYKITYLHRSRIGNTNVEILL